MYQLDRPVIAPIFKASTPLTVKTFIKLDRIVTSIAIAINVGSFNYKPRTPSICVYHSILKKLRSDPESKTPFALAVVSSVLSQI